MIDGKLSYWSGVKEPKSEFDKRDSFLQKNTSLFGNSPPLSSIHLLAIRYFFHTFFKIIALNGNIEASYVTKLCLYDHKFGASYIFICTEIFLDNF